MPRDRDRKAFTLVELLVVLAIIGVTAAIVVPNLRGSFGGMRVREAALTLSQTIRLAQVLAVDRQRTVRLHIESDRYRMELATDPASEQFAPAPGEMGVPVTLPENVLFEEVSSATDVDGSTDVLVFEPDGTWSAGRLVLTDGLERYLVWIRSGFGHIEVICLTTELDRDREQRHGDLLANPL